MRLEMLMIIFWLLECKDFRLVSHTLLLLILLWCKILSSGTLGCLLEDRNAWDVCPVVAWSYVSLVLIDEMWCVGTSGVYSYARLCSSTIFYLCSCYCFSYFDLTSNSMFTLNILHIYIYYIIETKPFLNLNSRRK